MMKVGFQCEVRRRLWMMMHWVEMCQWYSGLGRLGRRNGTGRGGKGQMLWFTHEKAKMA